MFKSTSSNEQRRVRSEGPSVSNNVHGIDPSVFKDPSSQPEEELEKLRDQYADALMRLNNVKRQISAGQGRKRSDGSYVDRRVWAKWQDEKLAIAGELLEINTRISHLKKQVKQANVALKKEDTFDACFKEVAKELLARPVYDRLITATIHRLGERQEAV
jgi:hypothetical protein